MSPKPSAKTLAALVLLMFTTMTGCKADNVFFRVENRSGETLHDVKVGFPGNDFTISTLKDSTEDGTRRHFDGPGNLTISYTTENGRTHTSSGPRVTGNEQGEVEITIDGGSASFDTKFDESKQ